MNAENSEVKHFLELQKLWQINGDKNIYCYSLGSIVHIIRHRTKLAPLLQNITFPMKLVKTGVTRWVLLIGKYAIKFPSFYDYRHFLQGILGNDQEQHWYRMFKWTKKLCPVLWCSWGCLIIVMPRVQVLTDQECRNGKLAHIDIDEFLRIEPDEESSFPCEKKSDSFGWLDGRLVIIDYGS